MKIFDSMPLRRCSRALVIAAAMMLLCPIAADAYPNEKDLIRSRQADLTTATLLDGVACNAAAAARTWTASTDAARGFALGAFQLDFTRTAATAVQVTITASLNAGTSWAKIPPCDSVADGTCTLSGDGVFERDVSGGSENIMMRADFLGAPDIKVVVSCTAGGANDTFDLLGRFTGL